ncbi:YopX family protein [Streptococcus ruminantium]|uniref:YopX family protein n=1 Tax=Streptococcus ruminantium TaxID=1917441 RepID=UPI0012DD80DD|nr:YopX family protein [Streptococcus ruminantium]
MIPKFRAWRKTAQKMVNVSSLDWKIDENEKESLSAIWWYSTQNAIVSSADDVSDDFILMQSTRVFDKDGKEIFDGDIVKTTRFFGRADETGGFYEYDKELIGIVKQLEGAWVIDTGKEAVYLWSEVDENEVIGNIYENPELVEN